MGANYAEAAYEQWPQLNHAEHRVLVRMAIVSIDKHPEPVYYAGWALLAFGLGCNMPSRQDRTPEAERLRANAKRAVARAVAGLVNAGAITTKRRGRLGVQAEYRLNLRPVHKGKDLAPAGDVHDHL